MNLNKELQQTIGSILGKDYFKLEFGTKIKCNDFEENYPNTIRNYVGKIFRERIDKYVHIVESRGLLYDMDEKFEIIGIEPTLAEIFLAVSKRNKTMYFKILGDLLRIVSDDDDEIVYFDLSESVFNQADGVKQAILTLLRK